MFIKEYYLLDVVILGIDSGLNNAFMWIICSIFIFVE